MDDLATLYRLDILASAIFIALILLLIVIVFLLARRVDDLEDKVNLNSRGDAALAKEVRQAGEPTYHTTKMPRGSDGPPMPPIKGIGT